MLERDDQLLNDLIDGRLSADEASELRARMATEAPLQERYDALVRVGDWLREQDPAKDVEAPAAFLGDVTARIAREAGSQVAGSQVAGNLPSDSPVERAHSDPAGVDPAGVDPARADAAADIQPGGHLLRMSDAAGVDDAADRRPPALRYLGFAYAAAAMLVVGLGLGFVLFGERETAPQTEIAKRPDLDPKQDNAGSIRDPLPGKGPVAEGIFQDLTSGFGDVPEMGTRGGASRGSSAGRSGGQRSSGPGEQQPETTESDLDAVKDQGQRRTDAVAGPGGSVRPGLREPSNDPSPLRPRRGERDARDDSAADVQIGQAPVLLYAVHADSPAAARAGLQLMLYQIAQAEGVRSKHVESAPAGLKPARDAETPQPPAGPAAALEDEDPADGMAAPAADEPTADKSAEKARRSPDEPPEGADADDLTDELRPAPVGGRATHAQAPIFVLRRLELASLDMLMADRAREGLSRVRPAEGRWGRDGAARRAEPASGPPLTRAPAPSGPVPSRGAPVPTTPATPDPSAPTPRAPASPAPAPGDAPNSDGPGPAPDPNAAGQPGQGLADGVVERLITLGQLRALENRFGLQAADVHFVQPTAGSKKEAQVEQMVRVRFVFVRGSAPR